MTAAESHSHPEAQLLKDSVTVALLADRRHNPSRSDVNMFDKWRKETKGPSNGDEMFQLLEQEVTRYNALHGKDGGRCFLQRFKKHGNKEQPLILMICTPLMARVHKCIQAGEMVFMDTTGSLDRHNNPVYIMCTPHSTGALPLAVWVTSSQSQSTIEECLQPLKSILPKHAFGGKGVDKGPDIVLTDDDSAQRQALQAKWKSAVLLLCVFHFLQETWRWLLDAKHGITKDVSQQLMGFMQALVCAQSIEEFDKKVTSLDNEPILQSNSNFKEYLNKALDRRKEWALCYRMGLMTRGNNTDNYTESMIFVFKCIILRRMRAYNLLELFHYITNELDAFLKQKLFDVAFSKSRSGSVAKRCIGSAASTVDADSVNRETQSQFTFTVPSRANCDVVYTVDTVQGTCTCRQGRNGNACPHQAAVALKYGVNNPNFVPQTAKQRLKLAILAYGDNLSLTQQICQYSPERNRE